ncbi:MAG TPA: hypothetical protein VGB18_05970 [Candidatus Thermoplasmatota archaeon]
MVDVVGGGAEVVGELDEEAELEDEVGGGVEVGVGELEDEALGLGLGEAVGVGDVVLGAVVGGGDPPRLTVKVPRMP